MASSPDCDAELGKEISKTANFVDKTKSELEEMFGLLYNHGTPRDMAETERHELSGLYNILDKMKDSIDKFEKDSLEVFGIECLKPTEMREPQGRMRPALERESGYKSADIDKIIKTPAQSSDRLSRTETDDICETSAEITEFYNPSIPCITSTVSNECLTKKEVPSFYIETPQTSSTSLANVEDPDNPNYVTNSAAEQNPEMLTVAKVLNDLSKPPSEEDNTKQAVSATST